MKPLLNWLTRNYKLTVLTVLTIIVVLLLADIYIRSNKTFDDVRFNNIATPIAAIVSVVLFVYLTVEQLRIQESAGLKQNFDELFEQLNRDLNESITERVQMAIGIPTNSPSYQFADISSLNYFKVILNASRELKNGANDLAK